MVEKFMIICDITGTNMIYYTLSSISTSMDYISLETIVWN